MFDKAIQQAYDHNWIPTTNWKDAFKPPLYEVGDRLWVNYRGIHEGLIVHSIGVDTQRNRAVYTCKSPITRDAVILVPEHLTVEPVKTVPYRKTWLHRKIYDWRRWKRSKINILRIHYRRIVWKLTPRWIKRLNTKRQIKNMMEVLKDVCT